MFRFSRDKRFFSRVSFNEFVRTARDLAILVVTVKPTASANILTCEDEETYNYSQVTFMADEVTEALKKRGSYTLDELTREVWDRSMSLQCTLRDATDPEPFLICMSCDRRANAGSLKFYIQGTDEEISDQIKKMFAKVDFCFSIGDGYSKPTDFNLAFGQRLTGLRL